ncbi:MULTISPECIES: hypothetical protein [Pseudomonas]|uniref:hypothetical protein n=1 Tax=Pseudomonas TaxID=286 RepID=UPI0013DFFA11|nr:MULTISPECIES: hypothetical protein [Pseudomonas]MCE0912054.1 hypothetical protein [Pseudomonas kurunegalensis]QIG17844.1 hypothetical protein FY041_08725 [Pseudomonas monteilii]QIG23101.1 hypothetical protein FY043_08720 [Pseudomonas monteilii]WJR57591.1 hypothetical protein LU664_008540 [Pseudomonas kurunegalensis]
MSKVIEIVVVGGVGSGKSHVLELIDKALRDGYGPHVQIVSRELSQERAMGSPGAEPSTDTIFELKERRPAEHSASETLKIEVDTSGISARLDSLQGALLADPLESAIASTASLIADERERLSELESPGYQLVGVLSSHLDRLLDVQISRVVAARREAVVDAIVTDTYGSRRQGM